MRVQSLTTGSGTRRQTPRLVRGSIVATALAVAAVGMSAGSASADPDGDTTANAVVQSGITLTALTPAFTLTGTPGATVATTTPVTYNVETNNVTGYTVTVQSATATMLPADTVANPDTIPIGDLTVRESLTTAYTAVNATTGVIVHDQDGRSANGGDALSTDFQMRIPTVNADTYSVTLNYLAATQL
jgi:hypothetical protein